MSENKLPPVSSKQSEGQREETLIKQYTRCAGDSFVHERAAADGCESTATVVALPEGAIDLSVHQAACAGCDGRCLGRLLSTGSAKSIRVQRIHIVGPADDLAVGDSLTMSVPRDTLIGLSSLAYLLPVVLMLLFAVVCFRYLSRSDLTLAVMALIGLGLGFWCSKLLTHWYSQSLGPRIRVVRTG